MLHLKFKIIKGNVKRKCHYQKVSDNFCVSIGLCCSLYITCLQWYAVGSVISTVNPSILEQWFSTWTIWPSRGPHQVSKGS